MASRWYAGSFYTILHIIIERKGTRRALILPLALTACALPFREKQLEIEPRGFVRAVDNSREWVNLPQATVDAQMLCPDWSPRICMSQHSQSVAAYLNKELTSYLFMQTGLSNLTTSTKIGFIEQWGQNNKPEMARGQPVKGFVGTSPDGKEQSMLFWLNMFAWETFKAIESQNLPADHFEGLFSYYLSTAFVHELGAAVFPAKTAVELKMADAKGQGFQKKYEDLYKQAVKGGSKQEALVTWVQLKRDLFGFRNQIIQEGRSLGLA